MNFVIILLPFLALSSSNKSVLHLGGLFPVSSGWFTTLGNNCLQSALLAIKHVNEKEDILADYTLALDYNDTKGSTGLALNAVYEYLYQRPPKVAIIGALLSDISTYTGEVTGLWKLVQISYSSTTPTLSNRAKYPYFFRTISSGNDFSPVRMKLMNIFGWRKVATLHETNGPYASVTNNQITLLKDSNYTIITSESFGSDPAAVIAKIKEKDARIIFGNFYESTAKKVFCEAYKAGLYGHNYLWIVDGYYTPGWWNASLTQISCTGEQMRRAIEGYMTIVWSMMNQKDSEVTVSGMTTAEYRAEMELILGTDIFVPGHQIPATNSYDAVWSAALALNATQSRILPLTFENFTYMDSISEVIFNEMTKTNFVGVSGPVQFSNTGDSSGTLLIEQEIDGSERTIGIFSSIDQEINWQVSFDEIWKSKGGSAPADSDNTITIVRDLEVQPVSFYVISALSGIFIGFATVVLCFNVYFRKKRVIKMSSPNINNLMICGCILIYCTVIATGLDMWLVGIQGYGVKCQIIPWILSFGFTFAFGSMFAKTWRVYTIFTNKTVKKMSIKDRSLFLMVGALLIVDTIILLAWQLVNPQQVERTELSPVRDTLKGTITIWVLTQCHCDNEVYWTMAIYIWKGLLLLFGVFLTWQTRKVKIPGLNDSQYIGMCIYNVVIFSVIGAPLTYILRNDPNSEYFIVGGFLLFCTTGTLVLVFVPKVIAVYKGDTGVIDKSTSSMTGVSEAPTNVSRDAFAIATTNKVTPTEHSS